MILKIKINTALKIIMEIRNSVLIRFSNFLDDLLHLFNIPRVREEYENNI